MHLAGLSTHHVTQLEEAMRTLIGTGRSRFAVLISLACALLLSAVPLQLAAAAPTTPEIEAKKAEAAEVERVLGDLQADLELKVEAYNAITEELQATRERIADTKEELALAEADLAAAQTTLESRATEIYRQGEVGFLEVLLSTTSFEDFLARLDFLMRINRSDAQLVADVEMARNDVDAKKRALEAREAEQIALRQEAEAAKNTVEGEVARREAYLDSLNAEVKQLIAEEQERQRKLEEELARKAAAAARTPTDPGALGAGHPEAVTEALKYLGVPYVWGGSSPSGFDCSGFTSYVYRQIGISIPRTSQSQFRVGQHIPPDRVDLLTPGDLVFFGYDGDPSRVHHVGMYVGDGNYIHAPQTGDVVRIQSLTARIASRHDYVGASRL